MTASLAAAIRRHVEEMEPTPVAVEIHVDDWTFDLHTLLFPTAPYPILQARSEGVPRGCWRIVAGDER